MKFKAPPHILSLLLAVLPCACSSDGAGGGAGAGSNATGGDSGGNLAGGSTTAGEPPLGGSSATAGASGAGSPPGGAAGASGGPGGGSGSQVEQWHPFELTFDGAGSGNPNFFATFSGPDGELLEVPGFQALPGQWKIRFAPTKLGEWSYVTSSVSDAALDGKSGALRCVANTNELVHGRLGVDPNNPHHFRFEDGSPHFMLAFEANWLGLYDLGGDTIPKAKALIDMYASRGFNEVLMNVYAHDTTWSAGHTSNEDFGPPAQYAWQGTNAAPDHSQLNLAFFENYDRVVDYLFSQGVVAHIMIKVYNKLVNWPAKGSADDDLFFLHVLARYQAYPNVIWDFAKESNNEPDSNYKTERIQFIREHDAYRRLVTTHTDEGYYASGAPQGILDFRTDQTHSAFYDTVIARRNASAWPVFNSEYGYEQGNDGGHTYGVSQDKLTVLKRACEVVMAGGYAGYYYTYHAWDAVRVAEVPQGLDYYKNLSGVFAGSAWYDLIPHDDLIDGAKEGRHCLANPGHEYIVYLASAGSVALDVQGVANAASLSGKWVDLLSGQTQGISGVKNGKSTLTNPWASPAMLHLMQ